MQKHFLSKQKGNRTRSSTGQINLRIIDFGLSTNISKPNEPINSVSLSFAKLQSIQATKQSPLHTDCKGTWNYMAPEVMISYYSLIRSVQLPGHGWNQAIDSWSIGCILIELYTGRQFILTEEFGSIK